jgi:phospholipid/cholesterol/gamma-HCH transport system substrate-binding protein
VARLRWLEVLVGLFMLAGLIAFAVLALKVSGYSRFGSTSGYTVVADFDNIGDLKVRAPVTIAGVRVGEVSRISLEPSSLRARVSLRITEDAEKIPVDSSAQILTQGLLGANYIGLTPGFDDKAFFQEGTVIQDTHPALILENLIGQLLFNMNQKDKEKDAKNEN